MDYQKSSKQILELLGGEENIRSLAHCVTRLRLVLNDESIVDDVAVENVPGVLGVMKQAGQYQIVMGNAVTSYYRELNKLGNFSNNQNTQTTEKKSIISAVIDLIAGSMSPLIPAILGGGMIKVLLIVLPMLNLIDPSSSTFNVLSFFGDAPFYFIPVMLAYSASQRLGVTPSLAVAIAGIMLHPEFIEMANSGTPFSIFGLNITAASYASSVIPIIIMVWLMSYIERFFDKIVPVLLKSFLNPLLVILVSGVLALVVVGPLGTYGGELLSTAILWIHSKAGWLALAIMTALMPLIVMTGMHWAFAPIFLIASVEHPDILILPAMLASNVAQGSAALAVAAMSKNKETKQIGVAAAISAFVAGVTEPALYGITLKYKKPLYAAMISGGITGVIIGITKVTSYVFANPSLVSIPQYIGPNNPSKDLINALLVAAISFTLTFVITWILGIDEESTEIAVPENIEIGSHDPKRVYSPLDGKVIKLEDVNDETFAKKMMGDGIAIIPTDGTLRSPFDGEVMAIFPTKHAIGIKSDAGVEVLIHVGIDTVKLEGEGFEALVTQGDRVAKGQVLLNIDLNLIESKGYDTTTPIIVTNATDFIEVVIKDNMEETNNDDALIYII